MAVGLMLKTGCTKGNKDFFFALLEVRVIVLPSQMHECKDTFVERFFSNWHIICLMKIIYYIHVNIHASFTWQECPIVFVKLLKFSIVLYTKDTCFGNNIE